MIFAPMIILINHFLNNPLLSAKILIYVSSLAFSLGIYYLAKKLSDKKTGILAMFSAYSFGYLFMAGRLEDNIFNLAMTIFFLIFFFNSIGIIKIFDKLKNFWAGIFLGLSLATHLNSILLYVFSALSYFVISKKNWKNLAKVFLFSSFVIAPIVLINAIWQEWSSLGDFFDFFSNGYESSDYWFFSNENKDFLKQFFYVIFGLNSIFVFRLEMIAKSELFLRVFFSAIFLIIFVTISNAVFFKKSDAIKLMICFFMAFFPYIMFYETYCDERWIFIIIPYSLINSLAFFKSRQPWKSVILLMVLFVLIISFFGFFFLKENTTEGLGLVDELKESKSDDFSALLKFENTSSTRKYIEYSFGKDIFLE